MKTWLETLRKELSRSFYADEVDKIVSYYEEMINDRLDHGETLSHILESYDIKTIVRQMTPEVLAKRSDDSFSNIMKSAKLLLIALLTTPLWIPLGVIYLVSFIVVITLGFVAIVVGFSSLVGVFGFIFELLTGELALAETLVMIGLGLITTVIVLLVALGLITVVSMVTKKMVYYTSLIAQKIGEKR